MARDMTFKELERFAREIGLWIDTYAPGDGAKRIWFFTHESDYFAGDGIYTALGLKEAITFYRGYAACALGKKSETFREKNPRSRRDPYHTRATGPIPSWYAEVWAARGTRLLGGVIVHRSSRFADKEDAENILETFVDTNERAGRKIQSAEVKRSNLPAEITRGGD